MGSIMALSLYRRHHAQCEGKHPKDSHSGELEERSKKWTRCSCPIIAAGALAKHFKRRKTGRIFWEDAKSVADRWEAAGGWPGGPDTTPDPGAPIKDSSRTSIADAIESWLAYHKKNSRLQYLAALPGSHENHPGLLRASGLPAGRPVVQERRAQLPRDLDHHEEDGQLQPGCGQDLLRPPLTAYTMAESTTCWNSSTTKSNAEVSTTGAWPTPAQPVRSTRASISANGRIPCRRPVPVCATASRSSRYRIQSSC